MLIPLAGDVPAHRIAELGRSSGHIATDARVLAALKLSFGAAFAAAVVNLVMGTLVAWVLVRYDFPFKRLLDAIVDLPFALPTAVAGIALAAIYAPNGWIGQFLDPLGIKVAFTPLGVVVALTFVGLPFVVRTVQPVMQDLSLDVEEASATLGATRLQTLARVVLPSLAPAMLTGVRARVRAGRRRIWLGDLHRRQPALRVRDRAAADHHQARGVRLCRRHGHRLDHAASPRSPCCWSSTCSSPGHAAAWRPEGDPRWPRRSPSRPSRPTTRAARGRGLLITGSSVVWLGLFLLLPLLAVFAEALRSGVGRLSRPPSSSPTRWRRSG